MAYLGMLGWRCVMPSFHIRDDRGPVAPLDVPGLLGKVPDGDFGVVFDPGSIPGDADVYVFHIASLDWMAGWAADIRRQRPDAAIILDTDDDLHRIPSYNPAVLDPVRSPGNNRRHMTDVMGLADLVTCATPELARFYQRWNPNVRVMPNYLHWPMWEPITPVCESRGWDRFRVGYMGHMDFHRGDLETIAPQLRKWLVANPDVEFVAAGDPRVHDVIGVPEGQRVSTSKVWFRGLDLPYITATMDVGLVPLAPNPFNEGKSCLKGMEYAACGIPCIASPTEEYKRWVDGTNGILARHPKDWVAALDALKADPGRVREMGRAARERARDASLDRHVEEWADAITSARHRRDANSSGARLAA